MQCFAGSSQRNLTHPMPGLAFLLGTPVGYIRSFPECGLMPSSLFVLLLGKYCNGNVQIGVGWFFFHVSQ